MQGKIRSGALTGVALVMLLTTNPARAETPFTTGAFKEACSRNEETWIAYCTGYAQALMDFTQFSGSVCVPDDANPREVLAAIKALTFDKIGTEGFPPDQSAIVMALAVVSRLFPCDR